MPCRPPTSAAGAQSEELELQYKTCYARVLDSKRRFLEAATRYYELSQIGKRVIGGREVRRGEGGLELETGRQQRCLPPARLRAGPRVGSSLPEAPARTLSSQPWQLTSCHLLCPTLSSHQTPRPAD